MVFPLCCGKRYPETALEGPHVLCMCQCADIRAVCDRAVAHHKRQAFIVIRQSVQQRTRQRSLPEDLSGIEGEHAEHMLAAENGLILPAIEDIDR